MSGEYQEFLASKAQLGDLSGFAPVWLPDFLFDFQKSLVEWAIRKGRAAIFADCGLGKTPMQLVWAENVVRQSNRPVLILTPLAVGAQTLREAAKFDIGCHRANGANRGIVIANYERLHHFDPAEFAGVVCDESSILKSFDGVRRQQITEFMRKVEYRLLCTATAAPNDYTELGTSSEALGYLGYIDMLGRFFKNDQGNSLKPFRNRHGGGAIDTGKWRFKGHAEEPFWRWVCSWGRAARRPSDLGFDDGPFILPALVEHEHVIEASTAPEGMLFSMPAFRLDEQRDERRRTIGERCETAATLCDTDNPAIAWCDLNAEAELLERLISGAVQVSGADPDEAKEEKLLAFASGQARVLVTKPKIGAWGLNFQHCNRMSFFPSHSFEQYYQAVRRCWRFGQTRPVRVDMVTSSGERGVMQNLQRKSVAADQMFSRLVELMGEQLYVDRGRRFAEREQVPAWL